MAYISQEEAEKYSSGGNGEWFTLKNDNDVARVQFMYENSDELQPITVHKVKVGDKERYVDCLRTSSTSPIDMCPFCAAGIPVKPANFILMYQHDDQKVKIWERGRKFIPKIQALFNRYRPLCNYVFEIERHGRPGDTQTTYDIFPMDQIDAVDLSNIEKPEILGGLVLSKTVEEMEYYLDNSGFPDTEIKAAERPARRAAVEPRQESRTRSAAPAPAQRSRFSSRAQEGEEVF